METTMGHTFDLHEGSVRIPVPIRLFLPLHLWQQKAALAHLPPQSAPGERVVSFADTPVSPSEQERLGTFSSFSTALWIGIFDRVVKAKHGGSFIFVPPTDHSELLDIKYKLNSNLIVDAILERCSLEPDLSHDFGHDVNRYALAERGIVADRKLLEVEDLVASLASVDGAVIVAPDLKIVGFGVRLNQSTSRKNDERQRVIKFVQHPRWKGLPHDDRVLSEFGTRHTSAVRFCEDVPEAVAFVVSQDGALRVFWTRDGGIRGAEPDLNINR
jgi:hypothetical protein